MDKSFKNRIYGNEIFVPNNKLDDKFWGPLSSLVRNKNIRGIKCYFDGKVWLDSSSRIYAAETQSELLSEGSLLSQKFREQFFTQLYNISGKPDHDGIINVMTETHYISAMNTTNGFAIFIDKLPESINADILKEQKRYNELLKIKEQLNSCEKNLYRHGYKLDEKACEGALELTTLQVIILNNMVHKELDIPYESYYQSVEG